MAAAKAADGARRRGGRAEPPTRNAGAGTRRRPDEGAAPQKHVIRTAELSVEVKDAAKALAAARRVATDAGGHVENESTERIDDTYLTSQIVLRVPQERYDSVLAELAGAGKLLDRKADAKDVTDQVVDVESRIATQRASVARVRALMDRADEAVRRGDPGGRAEPPSGGPGVAARPAGLAEGPDDDGDDHPPTLRAGEGAGGGAEEGRPGFGDALSGGWNALVGAAAWIGIVLTALAPWLAVALVLFVLWRRLVRPRLAAGTRPAAPVPGLPDTPRNAAGAAAAPGSPAGLRGAAGARAADGSAPPGGSPRSSFVP
ncbi:hypothetical protein STANM309S_06493 [Streptomyces tanashiensis]